jgi:hypothetical protein
MGIATVSGNRITDSGVNIFDAPVIPTFTTDGLYKTNFNITYIFPSTYLSNIFFLPYINKYYPETNTGLVAISSQLPVYNSSIDSSTSSCTVSGIQLCSNSSALSATGLTTLSFPDLKYLTNGFTMPSAASITTVNFPELIFSGTFVTTAGSGVTSLSFPKLEALLNFTNNLTTQSSVSFPELLYIGSFSDIVNSAMTSYSFPKLKIFNSSVSFAGTKSSLTSISFGALEVLAGTFTMPTTSTSLTSFSFASTLKLFNSNFVTTSNSLDQASVDNILVRLAALDGTGGTVAYSSRTVTITGSSATPSATGLAAKTTLQGRGCTVTTN